MIRALVGAVIVMLVLVSGCRDRSAPPGPVSTASTTDARKPQPLAAPEPPPKPRAVRAVFAEAPRTAEPSAACLAKGAHDPGRPALAIHRWVDRAGVTHYSDQPPGAGATAHRVIAVESKPPVRVQASGYDTNLPADLQQRAVVDALAVRRVFADTLGISTPDDPDLSIVFVQGADAYARQVGDPVLAASAGAYMPGRRTIYVHMQPDDEASFAVLRHEITHALVHELVGNLPVPINEGLAEYFRRYRVEGMGGQVDLAADRAALSGAAPSGDGTDALVDLLAIEGPAFYASDGREARYLRAYALIAVLLSDPGGIAALHEVLARQHADPCTPVAAETVLDQRYPGGLAALATQWARFLHDPPASVRAY